MKRITILCAIVLSLIAISIHAQERRRRPEMSEEARRDREERRARRMRRFMEQFKLDPSVPEEIRLQHVIDTYKKSNVYDTKTILFDVKAEKDDKNVVLKGEVIFPQHSSGLERVFGFLDYKEIDNQIKVLPEDGSVGTLPFALITTYTARIERDYTEPRSILDEAIYGQYVRLLKKDTDGKHYLVQIPNGYIGWVNTRAFRKVDKDEWKKWVNTFPKALVIREVKTNSGGNELKIPRGSMLPITKKGISEIKVQTPGNSELTLSLKDVQILEPNREQGKKSILEMAKPIMGLRYKWGGFSPEGYDCSGFTRIMYLQKNVFLPRDADQQSAVGEIVAFRGDPGDLLPGDLHYYANSMGRISHVTMSLGGQDYIHCSGPGIHISSFDPENENYNERYHEIFAFARRILVGGF
jgi:hypothetical protein